MFLLTLILLLLLLLLLRRQCLRTRSTFYFILSSTTTTTTSAFPRITTTPDEFEDYDIEALGHKCFFISSKENSSLRSKRDEMVRKVDQATKEVFDADKLRSLYRAENNFITETLLKQIEELTAELRASRSEGTNTTISAAQKWIEDHYEWFAGGGVGFVYGLFDRAVAAWLLKKFGLKQHKSCKVNIIKKNIIVLNQKT